MGRAKDDKLGADTSRHRKHSNSTGDENSSLQIPVSWNSLPCFKVLSLHSSKHTSLQDMAPIAEAIMSRNAAPILHSELLRDVIVHANNHHIRPRISSNTESDSLTLSNDRGRRWLLQIGGGTPFCQHCRNTLKFDKISIVPGEATQGEMVLCFDAVVASCEAGDSLVVHYVGTFDPFSCLS
jgi:hypothetical protein